MFKPVSKKIEILAKIYPKRIKELKSIFRKSTSVYIDFANVYHWQEKLKWHIDLKRLKQLFDSFDTIRQIRFYNGLLQGDKKSEKIIKRAKDLGYIVTSKPVKKCICLLMLVEFQKIHQLFFKNSLKNLFSENSQ